MASVTAPAAGTHPFAALNGSSAANSAAASANSEAGSADRFLKLLVTQLQNQDPLNPMDNAQITSQMAQINTVNGIERLNTSVQGLNNQFVQLQALTGASLVGNHVTLQGDQLAMAEGTGLGGFELSATASRVQVEILSAAGRVVDTLDLGAQPAGQHGFQWAAPEGTPDSGWRFRVNAGNGTLAVTSTPLMLDRVLSVSTSGSGLMLQTERSGSVPYGDVKSFN